MRNKRLEWTAGTLGAIGALLVALHINISDWGFVVMNISAVGWLTYGLKERRAGLVAQYVVFVAINLVGMARGFWT